MDYPPGRGQDAALYAGLHAEKYLLDGRQAGSGGGHHLTLGGATPLTSPFLLPHYLWRDFEDVLAFLAGRGLPLPAAAYRPFVDLRCPVVGTLLAGDVTLEVRNAIEPWHVLGEELTAAGTSRFVDSSIERIEVRARGLVPERHAVLVNGHALPLRPTGAAGEAVGGVRFRAWAPPHSLQPHLGIHHPIRLDVLDTWAKRCMVPMDLLRRSS